MSHKIIRQRASLLFLITGLLVFVGYILSYPSIFGLEHSLCDWYSFGGKMQCYEKYQGSLGEPLLRSLPYISIPFFLLTFLPQAYKSWKRFGVWVLPIMVVLVALTPVYGEDFSPVPPRDQMAVFLAKIYLVVSVIIIAYSWWQQDDEGASQPA